MGTNFAAAFQNTRTNLACIMNFGSADDGLTENGRALNDNTMRMPSCGCLKVWVLAVALETFGAVKEICRESEASANPNHRLTPKDDRLSSRGVVCTT